MAIWYANAEKRRAFRQVKHIKTRDVVVLVNDYGAEWEETPARLEASGYRPVKRRPAYATTHPAARFEGGIA